MQEAHRQNALAQLRRRYDEPDKLTGKTVAERVEELRERQRASFYLSLENMCEQALKLMQPEKLLPHFAERSHRAVTDTSGVGWGFHDTPAELIRRVVWLGTPLRVWLEQFSR